jgi:hypothetical protein
MIIGLLAVICIVLHISNINTRGENTFKILMLLLAHEESGCDNYLEISYGHDPRAVKKLLHTMVKQGYLDQRLIVNVTAPKHMHVRELYKLTPAGYKFAKLLKAKFLRRNR